MCFFDHSHPQQGSCSYDKSNRGAFISGSVSISSGNEGQLQAAVASTGPVAVAVDGSNKAFRVSNKHHKSQFVLNCMMCMHSMILTHVTMHVLLVCTSSSTRVVCIILLDVQAMN